jgi:glutathione synthase/RimK-type ligase-like ATP-grasp enzyme
VSSGQSVVVITEKFDPHADVLVRTLQARDVPLFRINTGTFNADYAVAMTLDGIHVEDRFGRSIDFPSGVRSVWHRKPTEPIGPEADPEARRFNSGETQEALNFFSSDARPLWVNNPNDNRFAQRKYPQLCLATELGLRVPKSLITNDVARAAEFFASCPGGVICKSLKESGYERDGETFHVFTRRVDEAEFAAFKGSIAACPTYFQEYVPKKFELRITVVDRRVFCCQLDSQAHEETLIDWRKGDVEKMKHTIVPLPAKVSDALCAMLDRYGLRFGTFDLVLTPDDEYVFLELNPNGQWYWIEMLTGAPMAEAMAALLSNGTPRGR